MKNTETDQNIPGLVTQKKLDNTLELILCIMFGFAGIAVCSVLVYMMAGIFPAAFPNIFFFVKRKFFLLY